MIETLLRGKVYQDMSWIDDLTTEGRAQLVKQLGDLLDLVGDCIQARAPGGGENSRYNGGGDVQVRASLRDTMSSAQGRDRSDNTLAPTRTSESTPTPPT